MGILWNEEANKSMDEPLQALNPSSSSANLMDLTRNPFLIAYLTLGYPSPQLCLELSQIIADAGADILELGIPPKLGILNGTWIKLSYLRARESGMDLESFLELASEIKHPKMILSYYSEIQDLYRFLKSIWEAGALGLLIPDLGFMGRNALDRYSKLCEMHGLAKIFFVQESFPEPIIHRMLELEPDLIYLGIGYSTGSRYDRYYSDPISKLSWLSEISRVPIVAGFGIESPDQVPELINAGARGIVIGSKLVKMIENGECLGSVVKLKISELIRELKSKLKASK